MSKALSPASSPAFELADFETPVTSGSLPSVIWSIEKHTVAQMIALSGLTKTQISRETGVPLGTINRWCQHGEFSEYINKLVLESAQVMKAKRLQILNKILDARVEEIEALGEGYARASGKDTLAIVEAIRKETGEEEAHQESQYVSVLGKIAAAAAAAAKRTGETIDITPD